VWYQYIPSYFTRLDHPDIAAFIDTLDNGTSILTIKSADTFSNNESALAKGIVLTFY
jgi:hypothetical protein